MSHEQGLNEAVDETLAKKLDRRKFLKVFGAGVATVSVAGLAACSNDSDNNNVNTDTSSDNNTDSGTSGNQPPEPPNGNAPGGAPGGNQAATYSDLNGTNETDWATGGVAAMKVAFPATAEIFANDSSTCTVTIDQTTLGPCFFAVETGEDISLGKEGIPMQVCLQIVDTSCTPIANAQVEIWHCDRAGVYSADTSGSSEAGSFRGDFCSGGDEGAENGKWFRGVLNTDGEGRVNFKTCFPGWYASRTSHIHFRIKQGSQTSLISQFCFEDALTEEVYTGHPAYKDRGNQDTPLSKPDNVFGSNYQPYIMAIKKNSDSSMLPYKRVVLSS